MLEVTRPVERSVESDIARTDEEHNSRCADQTDRGRGTVIEQLEAHESVEQENPTCCSDSCNMDRREALTPQSEQSYDIVENHS